MEDNDVTIILTPEEYHLVWRRLISDLESAADAYAWEDFAEIASLLEKLMRSKEEMLLRHAARARKNA